jgi:hypothetical protein
MKRLFRLFLTSCLLAASPAWCWWEPGHRVVARIAAAHLTPAARTRIARILAVPDTPEAVADALAQASTWADETKKETGTGDWHFINLTLQDRISDIPERCPDDNCATARIRLFAAELKSGAPGPRWSELDALRFLVHFVGDIHQPLHDISDADLGGNCERLDPPIDRAKNLHGLWDGGIIDAMHVSDRSLTASLELQIDRMHRSRRQKLSLGDQDDWAWEAHELGIREIYWKLHIPVEPIEFPDGCKEAPSDVTGFKAPIDGLYIDAMKPVVRSQLTKGGLRLARLLNETL